MLVAGRRLVDDGEPAAVVALGAAHGVDQPAGRVDQLGAPGLGVVDHVEHVEQAEQRPALAAAPARPVGGGGTVEHEVLEQAVAGLQQAHVAEGLAHAVGDQVGVAGEPTEGGEERRVEVQTVDEHTGGRVGEQRHLGGGERGRAPRVLERGVLPRGVDAVQLGAAAEVGGEVDRGLEDDRVVPAPGQLDHRLARCGAVEAHERVPPRRPAAHQATSEGGVAVVGEGVTGGEQPFDADRVAKAPRRARESLEGPPRPARARRAAQPASTSSHVDGLVS